MPGLVPGIHAFLAAKTWMAGTSPAMTMWHCHRVHALVIQHPWSGECVRDDNYWLSFSRHPSRLGFASHLRMTLK
jgi:hypothetical protein